MYQSFAARGVSLIVDLRSETDISTMRQRANAVGIDLLSIPIENGRSPAPEHLAEFERRHRLISGISYVHCEAGEGRTGAIIGAHQVANGRRAVAAIGDALAVGSLTFGQIAFVGLQGQMPLVVKLIEWTIDRPTELMFDVWRRLSDGGD